MAGFITALIIGILWGTLSLIMYIPYAHFTKDMSDSDKNWVIGIFLIGGPFLAIANVIEQLLDNFMPPGWGGEDDDFISKF